MESKYGENLPLAQALKPLLRERGMSIRELARRAETTPSHLSRVLRGVDAKRPSGQLARRVAAALDLPSDHFAEARIATILDRLSKDPGLRDEVYLAVTRVSDRYGGSG